MFHFTHNSAAVPDGQGKMVAYKVSEINSGVFDNRVVFAGNGGAVPVTDGKLTLNNNRFTENSAPNGGAVFAGQTATLVLGE